MGQPIPRFVIVRASAAIAGMLVIAAAVFFTIRYFEHQTELLDEQQAEREAAAKKQAPSGKSATGNGVPLLRGKNGEVLANVDDILKGFREKSDAYAKAFTEFKNAGMVRSFTMPSLESIRERGAMLTQLEDANRSLVEALKNAETTATAEFQKQGFTQGQSEKLAAKFVRETNLDAILELRNCDHELCEEYRKILTLLEQTWGTWKPRADDIVMFDRVDNAKLYNVINGNIVETGLRQRALQKKIREREEEEKAAEPKKPVRYDADFIGPRP